MLAAWTAMFPTPARAWFGPYPSGDGTVSMGMGGVSQVAAQEVYATAANPALATTLGRRFDVGLDYVMPFARTRIRGSALGPDANYSSNKHAVIIPQFGYVTPLGERFSFAISTFSGGLGTDYRDGYLSRFGGPRRSGALLTMAGLSNALAWRYADRQSIGVSVNVSYQALDVHGLSPFQAVSQDPSRVTDNGTDGAFGVSYSAGWHAQLLPRLEAGVSYRSRIWAQRFQEYAGLLPEHGQFTFPARYSAGLAYTPVDRLILAVEYQRPLWSREKSTSNQLSQLTEDGHLLGSSDGPGFGWKSHNNFKFGVQWQQSRAWAWRAGYSWSSLNTRHTETLIDGFAPTPIRDKLTMGGTYTHQTGWSVSAYAGTTLRHGIKGSRSIPAAFGGGEVDDSVRMQIYGLSIGRRID